MKESSKKTGPYFIRFFPAILDALRHFGGSGRPKEISGWIAEHLKISDEELELTIKSGNSRFHNQVLWAKFYLSKANLIYSSSRGVWVLSEDGRGRHLSEADALALYNSVQSQFVSSSGEVPDDSHLAPMEVSDPSVGIVSMTLEERLTQILRAMPYVSFERLCQRILREIGFENVEVTGRSSDGGIDVIGILRRNEVVAEPIVVQCKRWSGSVGSKTVRDLQGAVRGRAERGVLIATSNFTAEAKREAARHGATPIELIDLDSLINLLKRNKIGVVERSVQVVDEAFFKQFDVQ